ncbi:MAG TPA: UDP-glucose 4-epimerase GalE [Methylomirabilota bacterium]|nr:UDP-glucose 4-epimerase GalE [Methylomirabilota bacterium]
MRVLVTGGAGYIGSHVVLALRDFGHVVVALDDLSAGNRKLVPDDVIFTEGDVDDGDATAALIERHGIEAVMHFAGSIVVPESVRNPLEYYRNNTVASRSLIATCVAKGVRHFVFSSTAAVYGIPAHVPITEDMPTAPINPYGASKLMTEWMLRDTAAAHDLTYVSLRYFNVAGADPKGRAGQSTRSATHLIKIACEAAAGHRDHVQIFGSDYDTPDGTCIRDYIHVTDLADAHLRALDHLATGGDSLVLNCGYGRGRSVLEVLAAVERVAGKRLDVRKGPRRPGDPPALVADPAKLRKTLAWEPRLDDLDVIVRTALDWERRLGRR